MGHKYAELMFTENVKTIQQDKRSRSNYAAMEQGEDYNFLLSKNEAAFIAERDSFYMASVGETGWPYVQHRGGPKGFMKVLDAQTIGFADYSGNRQYISTGNFASNNRVALFFMDYPNRTRLKLSGRVTVIGNEEQDLLQQLTPDNYRARIERGFLIHVEAFDWNCPQHITPRYTEEQVEDIIAQRQHTQTTEKSEALNIGSGPLHLIVTGIRQLANNIRAYELRSHNGEQLPSVTPGSHLKIPVLLANGELSHRHYSICSNPARRDIYEIAVLEKRQGQGGSKAIHQTFQLGTQLHCEYPSNFFDVAANKTQPIVLIAGGIGITPIKALAQYFADQGNPVHLHYAGSSLSHMPFSDRLERALDKNISLYPADENKRMSIKDIIYTADKNSLFFACGPEKMLTEISTIAKQQQLNTNQIRLERFNNIQQENDKGFSIKLIQSDKIIEVLPQQSALDALLSSGVDCNHSCKTGACKQCATVVTKGEIEHRDNILTEQEKATLFCPCVSRAKTDSISIDL